MDLQVNLGQPTQFYTVRLSGTRPAATTKRVVGSTTTSFCPLIIFKTLYDLGKKFEIRQASVCFTYPIFPLELKTSKIIFRFHSRMKKIIMFRFDSGFHTNKSFFLMFGFLFRSMPSCPTAQYSSTPPSFFFMKSYVLSLHVTAENRVREALSDSLEISSHQYAF
ncbi:unnamed protein product [Ixodes pacificus]